MLFWASYWSSNLITHCKQPLFSNKIKKNQGTSWSFIKYEIRVHDSNEEYLTATLRQLLITVYITTSKRITNQVTWFSWYQSKNNVTAATYHGLHNHIKTCNKVNATLQTQGLLICNYFLNGIITPSATSYLVTI